MKPFYKSRLLWLAIISGACASAAAGFAKTRPDASVILGAVAAGCSAGVAILRLDDNRKAGK